MDEQSSDPDRFEAELASEHLDWEVPRQDIESASHEELVQIIVRQSELIRRLYEAAMLDISAQLTGQPVKAEDKDDILNPKKSDQ